MLVGNKKDGGDFRRVTGKSAELAVSTKIGKPYC